MAASHLVISRLFSKVVPDRKPKLPHTKFFLNNEWVDPVSKKTFNAINPSTGDIITKLPSGEKADVDLAVGAAKEAFRSGSAWRRMDSSKKGILIHKLADLIERDSPYLASLETLECGKLYTSCLRGDLPWAVSNLRYYAGFVDKNNGTTAAVNERIIAYSRNEPAGVCGIITAWNFSTFNITWKLAPALAAGCTTVVKPSQHSSLTALHIAQLVREAGFPPGVINFVMGGNEVGKAMVDHPDVDNISFTGSTEVGKHIYKYGSETLKRLTLGLGGTSSTIVLPDADLDKAVDHAHFAAFQNMGQCCCAGSRTFVHESIYKKFLEKMKAKIKQIKMGDPFDLSVNHGPQITEEHMESILKMIEVGKEEGATLELGGKRPNRIGFFVEPTLFTGVEDYMTIGRKEVFGPVLMLSSYKTIEEVVERANSSDYGLAASVFGQNLDEINTITGALRVGSVWINCHFVITPQAAFGGYKMSGLGREGAQYGIKAYTEVKSVFLKAPK